MAIKMVYVCVFTSFGFGLFLGVKVVSLIQLWICSGLLHRSNFCWACYVSHCWTSCRGTLSIIPVCY